MGKQWAVPEVEGLSFGAFSATTELSISEQHLCLLPAPFSHLSVVTSMDPTLDLAPTFYRYLSGKKKLSVKSNPSIFHLTNEFLKADRTSISEEWPLFIILVLI